MVKLRALIIALALLLGGAISTVTAAAAEEVREFAIDKIWFQKKGGGYAVNADLQVGTPALLEKMLRGGYPVEIHFRLIFYQQRDWLPDRVMGDIGWRGVLSYDVLKKQLLLTVGGRERRFASLVDAIAEINDLRASPSDDEEYIRLLMNKEIYLRARFNLHTGNLPLPMQISSFIDSEWQVDSGWQIFKLEVRE